MDTVGKQRSQDHETNERTRQSDSVKHENKSEIPIKDVRQWGITDLKTNGIRYSRLYTVFLNYLTLKGV